MYLGADTTATPAATGDKWSWLKPLGQGIGAAAGAMGYGAQGEMPPPAPAKDNKMLIIGGGIAAVAVVALLFASKR